MDILKSRLKIGATEPFEFLHMSDTHFALADERDGERKIDLARHRGIEFAAAPEVCAAAESYARDNGLMICHTGDFIDFVSEANLDRLKAFTDENDVFMAAGNHEFSLYVGEAWEDADYRNISLARVQAAVKNDFRFSSRVVNGVNLIAIDNGYYLFEREQLEALKREAARGLPMILFMHTPLFDPEICRLQRQKNPEVLYLVATPEELMAGYSDHRYRQQHADAVTLETVEFIKTCGQVKALFCGHLHWCAETAFTETIPQYVIGCTDVRHVTVE